ncbi:MAG TPA: adenylate/guanylate cyclase domain-containing protein [Blastocatellia bacterium]|nr:adenylate/guanylate cyclase domain-containing protein [Blastocatellia bacterium]
MFIFRVQAPGGKLFVYQLSKGETSIGRDPKNDLTLEDPRVSRSHAVVRLTTEGVTLTDLNSGNGTFVNGQRITQATLSNNDTIKIGNCTLTFATEATKPLQEMAAHEMREVLQKMPEELIVSSAASEIGTSREMPPLALMHELDKKERILALFYQLSRKLGSVFSIEEIYEQIFQILLEVTPASRVFIFRRNEQGELQQVAARTRDASDAGQPLPISRTIFAKVARERVSVLLENTQRDTQAAPSQSILLSQIHSVMAAPITGRKGLLGVIYADRQDVLQTFSSDDLDLLNAIAVQTGIAIDTVITHERLQKEAQARANYERFLPQQIVDDILRAPDKVRLGGVRQVVTAMFADVRGFTTLSESSSPEMIVNLLNRYFTLVSEIIFRHGGTLDKYIGDGLLALFGAPYASERDAVKAVRAAVDMQRAMIEFNRELDELKLPNIAIGIGINTGPAIVGYIGSETRLDYTAIGDTINTAARLESNSKPGQIIVSESTMQALDESFTLHELDTIKLKGKSENLRIAEVIWKK